MERFDLILVALAFALGFCMARVSLCAVATVRAWVVEGRGIGLAALAIAASASGLVLLLAAQCWPHQVMLPRDVPVTGAILAGGVLLAIGSLVNGGCYLGSLAYAGAGNSNYLFTIAGLFGCALWLQAQPPLQMISAADRPAMALPAALGLAVFACAVLCSLPAVRRALQHGDTSWRRWPWPLAALSVGLFAGLLFARHAEWSYSRLVDALAAAHRRSPPWPLVASSAALFLGVWSSTALAGRFHWISPTPLPAFRCLLGGAVMAWGAAHIPGGNDLLLLWAIPGLALYGFAAFAVMLTVIALAFLVRRILYHRRQRPEQPNVSGALRR